MLNKIIKHPLWSAIIASIIFSVLTSFWKSFTEKISIIDAFKNLMTWKVSFGYVLLAFVVLVSIIWIAKMVKKIFEDDGYTKQERELIALNELPDEKMVLTLLLK